MTLPLLENEALTHSIRRLIVLALFKLPNGLFGFFLANIYSSDSASWAERLPLVDLFSRLSVHKYQNASIHLGNRLLDVWTQLSQSEYTHQDIKKPK